MQTPNFLYFLICAAAFCSGFCVETAEFAPKDTSKDYLMGKFQAAAHPDFVAVPTNLTDGRQAYYLRKESVAAFKEMAAAAAKDGVTLRVISATRSFTQQKQIWEAKWNGLTLVGGKNLAKTQADATKRALKILSYSSMPSTSRHHWGTDFDINSLNPAHFNTGVGRKTYEWLVAYAAEYGFAQPYTAGRTKGYNEEKWHWSYTPLAQTLTRNYAQSIENTAITGFEGAATAVEIDMINNYVLGVNETCK